MALSFESVSVTLGRRPVLRDIDARFAPGRITVILGPNGSGKSTLLRTAVALVRSSKGRVQLDGADLADMPPRLRATTIGYLPQDATVHWNMAARDLIALGRMPHRTSAAEDAAAIADAMAATRTEAFAARPVRELSGGERARVLLARVLAGQPRWLLADEPLASLDPLHQFEALEMLRAVASSGVGVLLVLHDLTQAARIADDVVLLREGAILAAGDGASVLTSELLAAAFDIRIAIGADERGEPILIPVGRS